MSACSRPTSSNSRAARCWATWRAPPRDRSASKRSASASSSRSIPTPTFARLPLYVADRERAACAPWRSSAVPRTWHRPCANCRSADESTGDRLLLHDLPELPDESAGDPRAHADRATTPAAGRWLALPIMHQGETLGAMALFCRGSRATSSATTSSSTVAWPPRSAPQWPAPAAIEAEVKALRRYELLAAEARDIMLFVRQPRRPHSRGQQGRRARLRLHPRRAARPLDPRPARARTTGDHTGDQMAAAASHGILFETLHRRRDGSVFPGRGQLTWEHGDEGRGRAAQRRARDQQTPRGGAAPCVRARVATAGSST